MTIFQSLGFLRISLLALGLINALLSPKPGTAISHTGFEVIPTLVAPASAPIIIMVILFDALMSKIRASDSTGEESKKFKTIMWTELGVVAFMVMAWLPYYLAIGK
ncbi:MAG: hypothetical protein R8G33_08460 [Gammaproteobacteria bacterium]|nr:hypothetical protein [Gammaproteobacteria bacterium]